MLNNKSILITGTTGFIGSHLTELCMQRGFSVIAFDRYKSNNNWDWLEDFQLLEKIGKHND
jgi:nucleoside-diphosphate-sugar epimerase|tara:strand:- start:64 stop:246 length:183 start_codon:yes stop_codon:yes gene_type:complete